MFGGVGVEHELRQRAVQAGDAALHDGKARAGQLGGDVEVQAERRADIDVVLDLEIEAARRADLAHFDVAGFVGADRHGFMRQVGNGAHEFGHLRLHFVQARGRGLQFVADAADFGHHGGGVLALALEDADLLGQGVALALQFLGAGLDLLALGFQGIEGGDVEDELARGQAGGGAVDVLAEELNVDHGGWG